MRRKNFINERADIFAEMAKLLVILASAAAPLVKADPGAENPYDGNDNCHGKICEKEAIIAGSIIGAIGLALLLYCACKKGNQNDIDRGYISDNQQAFLQPTTTVVQMDTENENHRATN